MMIDSLTHPFRAKAVDDIYINISHFLDHFIMLILPRQPMMLVVISGLAMMKSSFMALLDLCYLAAWRRLPPSLPTGFRAHY